MVDLYYGLVVKGLRTIEQVPLLWREAVQSMLDEANL